MPSTPLPRLISPAGGTRFLEELSSRVKREGARRGGPTKRVAEGSWFPIWHLLPITR